jgi:hypothetical protein
LSYPKTLPPQQCPALAFRTSAFLVWRTCVPRSVGEFENCDERDSFPKRL